METNTSTETTKAPARKAKLVDKPKKAAKKVTKVVKQAPAPSDGRIALKTICGELEIETKLARRKLRAAKLEFHGHRERWTFTAKQAAQARELLAGE